MRALYARKPVLRRADNRFAIAYEPYRIALLPLFIIQYFEGLLGCVLTNYVIGLTAHRQNML
jgi:hypothetical protein